VFREHQEVVPAGRARRLGGGWFAVGVELAMVLELHLQHLGRVIDAELHVDGTALEFAYARFLESLQRLATSIERP
jgi:hypothetical protein